MTAAIGGAAQRLPAWISKNLLGLIITALVSGAVGYVVNVWLMAVRYEGSVTAEGAPAMSKDNVIAGGIFWAMFPMVVCSAIGYRRAVGKERFWRDVRRLPMTLVGLFRRDGSQGWVHLLWGAAIAMAATLVVPPAVGAVLGVGLLIGAPTIVGSLLSSLFAQLWRFVGRIVSPTKDHRVAPILTVAVGILGWAVALVIGFVLPGSWIRLVLAVACGAAAFLIGRRASALAIGATAAVLVFGAVVLDVLSALPVLADDGGFAECGSTLEGWLRACSGAGEVRRRAFLGLVVAAPGGASGFVGGGVVGLVSAQSGGGAWWDRLGLEELPGGAIDPATGESLVVNDGRWTDVPVGHVYFEGRWAHPEAVGAVPDVDGPFTPEPEDDDDPSLRPELWVPPLVAAALAGVSSASSGQSAERASARRARREADAAAAAASADADADADADAEQAAEAQRLVGEAATLRSELEAAGTDEDRVRVQSSLRAKAVEIANHPAGPSAVVADPTEGLAELLAQELEQRDTEVMGVFVERMNGLGVTRGGHPLDADDVAEVRQHHAAGPKVSPGNVRQLWKGYGSKKGKFAIDAETYLRFLRDRREDAGTTDEQRAELDKKIERLQKAVDDGVTTVMVSEQIWNEVAKFAYDQAIGGTV